MSSHGTVAHAATNTKRPPPDGPPAGADGVRPPPAVRPPWARPRVWAMAGGGLAVVVAVAVAGSRLLRAPEPPRMNEPAAQVVGFFGTAEFDRLPFDRQVAYLKQVEGKEDELVAAYRAGTIRDADYRRALQAAYLGRHLARMNKYFEQPAGRARDAYLDKLLDKKDAEKKGVAVVKKDGTKKAPKPDARDAADVKDIKRDDSDEAATVAKWPAAAQEQWKQYHAAVEARKQLRKRQEAEKQKPGDPAASAVANPPR